MVKCGSLTLTLPKHIDIPALLYTADHRTLELKSPTKWTQNPAPFRIGKGLLICPAAEVD